MAYSVKELFPTLQGEGAQAGRAAVFCRFSGCGMVIDLGHFERALETARDGLDHKFLDEVPDLGPATMENLSTWIWRKLAPAAQGLARVTVYRDSSGDTCSYFGPMERAR